MTLPGGHVCTAASRGLGWASARKGCATAPTPYSSRIPAQEAAPQAVLELEVRTSAEGDDLWVFLRGEADLGNHELLQVALARIRVDGVAQVHLVLAELAFCDLYAFRDIVAFAGRVRAARIGFVAHGARPMLRTMATVVDVTRRLRFV